MSLLLNKCPTMLYNHAERGFTNYMVHVGLFVSPHVASTHQLSDSYFSVPRRSLLRRHTTPHQKSPAPRLPQLACSLSSSHWVCAAHWGRVSATRNTAGLGLCLRQYSQAHSRLLLSLLCEEKLVTCAHVKLFLALFLPFSLPHS